MTFARCWIGLIATTACSATGRELAPASEWEVSAAPGVTIGVVEGNAPYELHRVTAAVRTRDGRIIVANSGTSELRVFDSAGIFLTAIGREGSGPGEFRDAITLFTHAGDSLVAYDRGTGRFSLFSPDGPFIRQLQIDGRAFPWDDWLHAGAWVSGVRDATLRPCVAAALEAIGVSDGQDPPYRRAILDDAGHLWVRPLAAIESPAWRVYSLDGSPLGRIRLPSGFRPYHIGTGFVLGARTGADESERIELYTIAAPAPSRPLACDLPSLAPDTLVPPDLGADLGNAVMAQEMYFADHQAYAAVADSLEWSSTVDGTLLIVSVSAGGWAGVLARPGGPMCAIAVGDVTPAGWPEGSPQCAAVPRPGQR